MEAQFRAYLGVLRELTGTLDRLAPLEKQKAEAARAGDLLALDEVLKQEQALGLNLRGMELKRQKLAPQLGLDGAPLSALPERCPPELADEARKTAGVLRRSYEIYRSYSDMARNTLELNLHQIDKFLEASGVDPKLAAQGYEALPMEPPKKMKTDFRACGRLTT